MIHKSHYWLICKGNETSVSKGQLHSHVYCSVNHNNKEVETTGLSTDEWKVQTHTIEYYWLERLKSVICGEGVRHHYVKWSKPDTKTQVPQNLIHRWNHEKLIS
jgi:hypothetical protein